MNRAPRQDPADSGTVSVAQCPVAGGGEDEHEGTGVCRNRGDTPVYEATYRGTGVWWVTPESLGSGRGSPAEGQCSLRAVRGVETPANNPMDTRYRVKCDAAAGTACCLLTWLVLRDRNSGRERSRTVDSGQFPTACKSFLADL